LKIAVYHIIMLAFSLVLILEYRKIRFRAILFDLDGTLLDTLTDIADSMNAALQRFGFPSHPVEAYRYFVGDSVSSLVRRTLPKEHLNDENIDRCQSFMLDEYSRRWSVNTKPYPQIPELLSELEERNVPKAVLSNKPDNFTKLTVKELLSGFSFDIVQGVNDDVKRKPDTAAALGIAEKLKIAPADFLYLGDTNTDMQTAVAAGMYPAGALWGFRTAEELKENGAKILVEKPLDVLKILDSKAPI